MTINQTDPRYGSLVSGLLLALITHSIWAQPYKCRQPDGGISYQQTACTGQAEGERLQFDRRGPDGREGASSRVDYSVSAQAERLRAEREARERAYLQSRRAAEARSRALRATTPERNPNFDPITCARHRAEVAKWRQRAKASYRTREEKEYNDSKLAYHEALVARYCE
ncbi:MAG: DUF4124 domain-containing protein [Thermochromatium sp.]